MSPAISSRKWFIRPISEDELGQVLEVYRQCEDFLALGPQPKASMEMVLADLRLSREAGGRFCGIFWGKPGQPGEEPAAMIGVLDWVPERFEGDPAQAFISLLMIAAPYRSQGIGAEVVAWVEGEIRKNPRIDSILTGAQVNNPAAIRFWNRQGYAYLAGPINYPDGTVACTHIKKAGVTRH